ncbi:indole-3-glycerol-phosphate synthase [Akkermansia glycaniphila]|uniref:indole-3-glycerol phosphate synthase TrpC n=1 Tax=Akkermansia glycaniphila TaxID=1679444 RepID=UPI001C0377DB|nr:indole-3-glycerol-phosphate synthase [Akkermansia glycaniphila]MBT9450656.1 indole-3-glycerol-phosphate synthase [Akkermansia glycaniphila]
MNLQRFIDAKQDELEGLRRAKAAGLLRPKDIRQRPDFLQALRAPAPESQPLRVIAEFKRSSPSMGVINDSLTPEDVARQYAEAGATCMSVLTEEKYFTGCVGDLSRAVITGLPLLRKDFIFDELQVRQTVSTPAAAMLLIVALTPDASLLRGLREMAESEGIHAVVEIFNERELEIARESGARILQVNARNLETFKTDREEGLKLAALRRPEELWIAASAMSEHAHLVDAKGAGYDAALIGTALMQSSQPGKNLNRIIQS